VYATREGQTRKIAEHLARVFRIRGVDKVQAWNVRENANRIRLDEFSAVILAASVHGGTHEPEMLGFVKQHRDELDKMPTAFLSVSLSEAGVERADAPPEQHAQFVADVEKMLERFFDQTGWRPTHAKPIAGALVYSKYNFLIRFVMKRIARRSGGDTDTSRDYEYTDWLALDRFAAELADKLFDVTDSATGRAAVAQRFS
jgi:menaquinone-dependent protoporphyrinogen oxidase